MSIVHRYHLQVSILLSIFLILSIATGMPRTARAAARASVTQPSAAEPARINYLTAGDLSITKSADPVPAGEILTYEVTVYNNSSDVITDTVVTDTLPLELNYQADSWGCSLVSTAPDILSCALGDLPAGGSRLLRITETYTDPNRYIRYGDEFVWDRSFGRSRNTVVLPQGWYLTANAVPATVSTLDDGRVELVYSNDRPGNIDVLIKGRER